MSARPRPESLTVNRLHSMFIAALLTEISYVKLTSLLSSSLQISRNSIQTGLKAITDFLQWHNLNNRQFAAFRHSQSPYPAVELWIGTISPQGIFLVLPWSSLDDVHCQTPSGHSSWQENANMKKPVMVRG